MDFRILGPVEVFADGQPLPLGGQRQRALLAYLLLHANGVVAGDRLLDELWFEIPGGGLAALQTQVSRLRRILGDRIVTAGAGYSIRLEEGELDLDRFRSLLADAGAAADAAERSVHLRAADALWRGAPLAGLDVPFAASEAAGLEELRLAALEDRIEADLELGHDGECISELSGLIARHPLRERLRGQLILGLYRSGRQADALEAYRETRRILDEELGLEPSPALRELERAILCHDPGLARLSPAPPESPPSSRPRVRSKAPLVVAALVLLGSAAASAVALMNGGETKGAVPVQTVRVVTERVVTEAVTQPRQPVKTTRKQHKRTRAATPVKRVSVVESQPSPKPAPLPTTTSTQHRTRPATSVAVTTDGTTTQQTPARTPTKPAAKPVTISDSFNGDQIDGTIWYQVREGTGWEMSQHNGRLELTFPPGTTPGPPYGNYGGHVGTLCKLPGDFDARVDYTLVDWPPRNGMLAILWSFFLPGNEGWQSSRSSSAQWGEQYGSYTGPGRATSVPLDDTSGTLRLARRNGLVTAYFLHNGHWQSLTSARNTSRAAIAVGASGSAGHNAAFGGQQVVVGFDNFSVTAVNPICPPGSQPGH